MVHEGTKEEIIQPGILRDIFDLNVHIEEIQKTRICVYFNNIGAAHCECIDQIPANVEGVIRV